MAWPPALSTLKLDMKIAEEDTRDDERLQLVLDAAVGFVERVHRNRYNFTSDPGSTLPAPPVDMELGTLRLASRWHVRRRSPDALIQLADQGAARVPSFDVDIDRLLRIGRFAPPVVA